MILKFNYNPQHYLASLDCTLIEAVCIGIFKNASQLMLCFVEMGVQKNLLGRAPCKL
jgi:hypothetical protein